MDMDIGELAYGKGWGIIADSEGASGFIWRHAENQSDLDLLSLHCKLCECIGDDHIVKDADEIVSSDGSRVFWGLTRKTKS